MNTLYDLKPGDLVEFVSDGYHCFYTGTRVPVGAQGKVTTNGWIEVLVDGKTIVSTHPKSWGLKKKKKVSE